MDNFIRIFEVVLPLLILLVFGYVTGKRGILSKDFIEGGSKAVYGILLPIFVFNAIYSAEGFDQHKPAAIAFNVISLTIVGLIYGSFLKIIGYKKEEMAVLVSSQVRANMLLFGIPIAQNYYGEAQIPIISLYVAIMAVTDTILGMTTYEILTPPESANGGPSILKSIVTNRILIGVLLAVIIKMLGITLYSPIVKALNDIGSMATPLGLICIGGMLKLESSREEFKSVTISMVTRAVIVPIIMLAIGVFLGFRDIELFIIVLIYSAPMAISTHGMSVIYTSMGDLCAKLIMFSTIFNSVTIFFALLVLSSMGFI